MSLLFCKSARICLARAPNNLSALSHISASSFLILIGRRPLAFTNTTSAFLRPDAGPTVSHLCQALTSAVEVHQFLEIARVAMNSSSGRPLLCKLLRNGFCFSSIVLAAAQLHSRGKHIALSDPGHSAFSERYLEQHFVQL
jgi:hypothetical protein